MIESMVKEMVWVRVKSMFMVFIDKHIESLSTQAEKNTLIQLINNSDEWSKQILNNLWEQFEEKELSNDTFENITKEVVGLLKRRAEL